jgi:hypothetical protein
VSRVVFALKRSNAPLGSTALFAAMHVLNNRAALLSNYEVLQLLKELEADHIARTRTAQRLKKEEEDATGSPDTPLTISENLRTIEVEVSSPALCAIPSTNTSSGRPYSTSPQTISPPACKPPRASNASRRTSPLSASPKPKSSKSSTLPPSSPSSSTSCVLNSVSSFSSCLPEKKDR